jgi:hypothetical protein
VTSGQHLGDCATGQHAQRYHTQVLPGQLRGLSDLHAPVLALRRPDVVQPDGH